MEGIGILCRLGVERDSGENRLKGILLRVEMKSGDEQGSLK